jgi:polysaccharide pyruvyl transferase WcaK-like protein
MLVLRDDASADVLAGAGVPEPLRVGADAAWTLFDPPPAATAPGPGRVVVTVSRHAGGPRLRAALAAALADLAASRPEASEVVLEPWQPGGPGADDLDLARELSRALRVARAARGLDGDVTVSAPPESVPAASAGYRGATLVVGQRFHSLLAAAAAGVRFVAVAHEPKSADLAARLGQRSVDPDAPVADVAATLAAAVAGPPPDPGTVAELTHTAHTMLALVRAVVSGGRSGCPDDLLALHLHPEAVIR